MRITRIEIGRWRNLVDVTIDLGPAADFLCLVGENGAGKSHLLELLAYAAPRFGFGEEKKLRVRPRRWHCVTTLMDCPWSVASSSEHD